MFAQRFDPTALLPTEEDKVEDNVGGKRRLSQTSISSEDSEDSESDSDSSEDNSDSSEEDSESSDRSSEGEGEDMTQESQSSRKSKDEGKIESEDIEMKEIKDPEMAKHENDMEVDSEPKEPVENDPEYLSKHLHIFTKFQKSVNDNGDLGEEMDEENEEIEKQDLAPLPQPMLPRDKRLISNTNHLKNLDWLATPIYASPEETKPLSEFKTLAPFMIKNLEAQGIKDAFSVQISVLNLLLEDFEKNKLQPDFRGDLLVNAATGSGKTLAYLIPIIQALHKRVVPRVRAIILVPTKPLINQVKSTLSQISKGTNLSIVNLKNDKSINEEASKLTQNEPDIIVSTPGRLVDHITKGSISLKYLRYLVIDEADRLLNQSFQNWCQTLISSIEMHQIKTNDISNTWSLKPQKLIFSATLTTDAGKLSHLKFEKPRLVIINNQEQMVNEIFSVPATLSENKISLGSAKSPMKPLILAKFLIDQQKTSNVLVFAKSNEASLRLSRLLTLIFAKLIPNESINVMHINSTNNITSVRTKILKDFSNRTINILIATDLIARGIDLLSIADVVNYDLPNSSREYVHRVGRTARANQLGHAYTLCFGKGETKWFNSIMKDVGRGDKSINDVELDFKTLVTSEDEHLYADALQDLQKQVYNK